METTLFILTGLPGSGKTTYAETLSKKTGATILSLDTEMFKRYGDDHHIELEIREKATKYDLQQEIETLLTKDSSVILDYGFYKNDERIRYKKFAKRFGVNAKVIHITAPYEKLLQRVEQRNIEEDNIHHIDKEILDILIKRFEVPEGDVEIIET
ncbi:MAG: ATP-binding protein [Candidatus Pacebacteria bacterium]|nr:ATP-binding protein [Candidatus Paceibacterota bacterium]